MTERFLLKGYIALQRKRFPMRKTSIVAREFYRIYYYAKGMAIPSKYFKSTGVHMIEHITAYYKIRWQHIVDSLK